MIIISYCIKKARKRDLEKNVSFFWNYLVKIVIPWYFFNWELLSNSKWFEGIETIEISILDQKKFRDFYSQWSSDNPSFILLVIFNTPIGDFKGFFSSVRSFFQSFWWIFESAFYISFIQKIQCHSYMTSSFSMIIISSMMSSSSSYDPEYFYHLLPSNRSSLSYQLKTDKWSSFFY